MKLLGLTAVHSVVGTCAQRMSSYLHNTQTQTSQTKRTPQHRKPTSTNTYNASALLTRSNTIEASCNGSNNFERFWLFNDDCQIGAVPILCAHCSAIRNSR